MESDLLATEELTGILSLDSDYEDEPDLVDTNCLFEEEELLEKKLDQKNNDKHKRSFKSFEATQKWYKKILIDRFKLLTEQFYCTNGLQVVVLVANLSSADTQTRFNAIGSEPLKHIVMKLEKRIMENLTTILHNDSMEPIVQNGAFKLPPLVFNGIRTSVTMMNQNQLRTFIPMIIKYSTGRQKPMYGKHGKKPCWWPDCVPWKNIRYDTRHVIEKLNLPWTEALRQVVISCYKYHNRLDLLTGDNDNFTTVGIGSKLFNKTDDDFFKIKVRCDEDMGTSAESNIKTSNIDIINIDEGSDLGVIKQECIDISSDGECFD